MRLLRKPWSHNAKSRNFTTTALRFGALPQLVTTLNRPRFEPLNQGDTLRCAVFAAVMNGKYIHGADFSIEWTKSKISRLQGNDVDSGGSEPNAAMDSQTYSKNGGYLPKLDWGLTLDIEKLDLEATDYSNSGYVKPTSGKDVFDSICMELQRHYNFDTKRGACVQLFISWHSTFYVSEITTIGTLLGYHSLLAIDFDRSDVDESKHYLVLQNSYGENIGDKGFHKMYRPVVNELLAMWGTSDKTPSPLTPEQIALAKTETPLGKIQRQLIQMFYDVALLLKAKFGRL